ncbi:rho GTPase-activating protein 29 isoform X2 [Armigeres subalbatus]|uniref:rho GTPase-activating protein 29 isoform X2 n=1 Tax=Armigeres subalbatus TaxID=124917 RepID=UPI002ED2959A
MDHNNVETPVAESNCVNCDRLDSADNLVQCDQCDAWWHMSCAQVSQSVENRQWICRACQVQEHNSIRSGSPTNANRLELQMRKLEERHALEKKFLEEKYRLLEMEMDNSPENVSTGIRSSAGEQTDFNKVRLWINACEENQAGAAGGRSNAQLMTEHTSRNHDWNVANDPTTSGRRMCYENTNEEEPDLYWQRSDEERTQSNRKPSQQTGSVLTNYYESTTMGTRPIPKPRRLMLSETKSECQKEGFEFPIPPPRTQDCGFVAHIKCSELVPAKCVPDLKRLRGIFGVDLTTLVTAHKCKIPFIVKKCVEEVERHGMLQEGIYRISGFADEIDALKMALDKDGEKADMAVLAYSNINVISGVLKLYLRLLPVPLITFHSYPAFMKSTVNKTIGEQVQTLRDAIKLLPLAHFNCLKYILEHLNRIASHHAINKMNESNIATVFAPTLIATPQHLTDLSQEINMLTSLITHCHTVFL